MGPITCAGTRIRVFADSDPASEARRGPVRADCVRLFERELRLHARPRGRYHSRPDIKNIERMRMAQNVTRMGIIGAGWPGAAHARGCAEAGGFKVVAVADLIPARRRQIMSEFGATREYADAKELIDDKEVDAVA